MTHPLVQLPRCGLFTSLVQTGNIIWTFLKEESRGQEAHTSPSASFLLPPPSSHSSAGGTTVDSNRTRHLSPAAGQQPGLRSGPWAPQGRCVSVPQPQAWALGCSRHLGRWLGRLPLSKSLKEGREGAKWTAWGEALARASEPQHLDLGGSPRVRAGQVSDDCCTQGGW